MLKMDELKLVLQDQKADELWKFDVRHYVLDSIFRREDVISERIKKIRKIDREKTEKNIYEDIDIYYNTDNVLVKTAIGKKWAAFFDYDYDASRFANEVYKTVIFPSRVIEPLNFGKYEYMLSFGGSYYRGDTMNSWSTTVNEFIRVHGEDYFYGWSKRYIPKGYSSWEAFLSKPDNYKKDLPDFITNFMNVVYTIGNLIPTPLVPNFNTRRSILCRDYWDLTLLAIYRYFIEKNANSDGWNKLFQYQGIQSWLNGDGEDGWDNFVKRNFLQDFINQNPDDSFGKPRELWHGHFDSNSVLPQNPEDYQQFFDKASTYITERGKSIAIAIKKELYRKSDPELSALAKKMAGIE